MPLGGSRGGIWKQLRNTLIIFVVSGFWHGANWTFIIWGIFNAVLFLPYLLTNKNRKHLNTVAEGRLLPSLKEILNMLITFGLTTFAWIFFRSESLNSAIHYIDRIISRSLLTIPEILPIDMILFLSVMLIIEWFGENNHTHLPNLG